MNPSTAHFIAPEITRLPGGEIVSTGFPAGHYVRIAGAVWRDPVMRETLELLAWPNLLALATSYPCQDWHDFLIVEG